MHATAWTPHKQNKLQLELPRACAHRSSHTNRTARYTNAAKGAKQAQAAYVSTARLGNEDVPSDGHPGVVGTLRRYVRASGRTFAKLINAFRGCHVKTRGGLGGIESEKSTAEVNRHK